MDLDLLSMFVSVAEAASFSVAAKKLRLPKSSVSRGVARLEDGLGAQLLHRTTRHVSLTTAGAALYERTAPLLASLRSAVGALPERQEQPSGELRITAPNELGPWFLAEMVARFVARYPSVRVDAHLTTRAVDLVAEGFDLALRGSVNKLKDSSLTARWLGAFQGHLYASPSYLARRGAPRGPRDLKDHDWVVFRNMRGPLRLEGPGEPVMLEPRGRITADDFLFVREAVRSGAGIALFDSLFAEKDVTEGRLVCLLPRYRVNAGALYLVYPSTRHLPRKVIAFREILLEVIKARSASRSAAG
jgi:DNA-binding transcriptional LysR family regulator